MTVSTGRARENQPVYGMATILQLDEEHVFDLCAKYLARDDDAPRHNYLGVLPSTLGRFSEGWRFPVVEAHFEGDPARSATLNDVTFVYLAPTTADAGFNVGVRGTFGPLHEIVPLQRVGDSRYHAVTLVLAAGQCFRYRFVLGGTELLDPVNPQTTTEDNGSNWSQFFTFACFDAITFERWERIILQRLVTHILPFNTRDAEIFQESFGPEARANHPYLHRFDLSVGVVNYIDKVLAREERHQLPGYKACLVQINRVLRQRNPYLEPRNMPESMFVTLYNEMAANSVPGWDAAAYGSPAFFLQMLRRHAITGAFCHPKYGGNAGGVAWNYFRDRYRDEADNTLFDWERAIEQPLGRSTEYFG